MLAHPAPISPLRLLSYTPASLDHDRHWRLNKWAAASLRPIASLLVLSVQVLQIESGGERLPAVAGEPAQLDRELVERFDPH